MKRQIAVVGLVVAAQGFGCGASDAAGPIASPGSTCDPAVPSVVGDAVVVGAGCADAASLRPRARLAGVWRGGGSDGACSGDGTVVRCPAGDAGAVEAVVDTAGRVRARFVAARAVVLEGLSLDGASALAGATARLSNGFQSWSQAGVVALAPPLSGADLDAALASRGDAEVLRDGTGPSWSYGFVGGGERALFAGALTAARWKPWVDATRGEGGAVGLRLGCGGAGEQVAVAAGATVEGEPFAVEIGPDLAGAERRWAAALATHRAVGARGEVGWNSWYELWDGVSEADVRANAPLARAMLEADGHPAGAGLRIVVDDGWEKAWGDWEPNDKFPSGLDGLARDLGADGDTLGVWLAPLLAAESSAVYTAHPDWFVGGVVYQHTKNGRMHVLDVTNAEAAEHLSTVIGQIARWGYGLLKIDFLFAGTWEGQRALDVTGMDAYARALAIIRSSAGDAVRLVAVGAPDVATLPWVDGWRVGADIALELGGPRWPYVANQARSVAARWPLCAAVLCDADPVLLRGLARDEVESGGWVAALAGGAMFLSDDLPKLAAERRTWGVDAARLALGTGGSPAEPEDVFPASPPATLATVIGDIGSRRTTHVVPARWRLPGGGRLVLDVTDEVLVVEGVTVPPHATRTLSP